MAKSLQRLWSHGGSLRSAFAPMSRPFSADALVEIKPGEIGMVSGIPEEHLRRRVCFSFLIPLQFFYVARLFDFPIYAESNNRFTRITIYDGSKQLGLSSGVPFSYRLVIILGK